MADMTVIDKDGDWYVNRALYRFPHGTREGVVFESGVPTRVVLDDWIKGQPLIEKVADPFGELPGQIETEQVIDGGMGKNGPTNKDAPVKKK